MNFCAGRTKNMARWPKCQLHARDDFHGLIEWHSLHIAQSMSRILFCVERKSRLVLTGMVAVQVFSFFLLQTPTVWQ